MTKESKGLKRWNFSSIGGIPCLRESDKGTYVSVNDLKTFFKERRSKLIKERNKLLKLLSVILPFPTEKEIKSNKERDSRLETINVQISEIEEIYKELTGEELKE